MTWTRASKDQIATKTNSIKYFGSDLNLDTCKKIVIIKCYCQFTLSAEHVTGENSRKTEIYDSFTFRLVFAREGLTLKQIMVVTKIDNMASYSTYTGKPKIFFPKKVSLN